MKREWNIFLSALSFFTRIPVKIAEGQIVELSLSVRYFPLVGWLAGTLSALIFFSFDMVFGQSLAIIFSMLSTIFLTGALHEDGLADVCDGFGGGWTRDKILEIMKDSCIGTYGVIGLVFITSFKFFAIQQIVSNLNISTQWSLLICMLVLANTLSRFNAIIMIFTHTYVRAEKSKSAPMVHNVKISNLYIALIITLIPLFTLLFYTQQYKWVFVLFPLAIVNLFLSRYFNKWIGGYTGDCLGAIQQISEVVVYLSIICLWKFF